jgi:uncharacterized protein YbjT (DUF2867 family)
MITIMGATGNTGRVVAETLLGTGKKIRVLGRSEERLRPFVNRGAEAMEGDADDAAFLTRAFQGSDAVYTLIPPNLAAADYRAYQKQVGEAITEAVRRSGVKNVVLLSSIGAQHPSGTGPIAGLHEQEERLKGIQGLNALFLRAGYFFENHFLTLGLIKQQGINGSALRGDVPIAMIASHDVGEVAANALAKPDFKGPTVREALGAADLTMQEATRIIGRAIEHPDLGYMQFPYEAALEGMKAMGLPERMASLYVEMSRGINEGLVVSTEGRNAKSTTPTRFEDFARDALAPAFRAM